jgi:ABC-type sugar transport system permease subunit/ABC-type glycerol-3-phosphate transport system substrate-binding protein
MDSVFSLVHRYIKRALLVPLLLLAASAFADKVQLRFTVWDGDESLKVIKGVLAQFQAENPNIEVKLESIADYNGYHQKMLTQYAAGVAPDVCMMDPGHFQALAKRGALLPLNPFFKQTPGFDINKYYKKIVDAHSSGGVCYVLPRDIAPMGLVYYNKRAFNEAGLKYPDGTWTWDFKPRPELREHDFVWVCQQLTKRENGHVVRWAYASGWPEELAQTFAYSLHKFPANDFEHPTKVTILDPEYVKAYQYASDFMNTLHYMPNSTETSGVLQQTTQQLFAGEKIAMFQNGIWEVPNMRKMLKPGSKEFFDWDITLFPAYADGRRGYPTGGSGYGIFSSTPHPQEAWKLASYMAGPVGMIAMAKAGIAQPAIRDLALKPGIWVPGPDTPKEQLYPYHRIYTDTAVKDVYFSPNADYWPSVSDRIGSSLDLLWSGQIDAKTALTQGQSRAQERLDTMIKSEDLKPFNWTAGALVGLAIFGAIVAWVYWPERKVKYTYREKLESRTAYRFAAPFIIGMLVFTLGPMIVSLLMSFADWDAIQPARWRGLGNYYEAGFVEQTFWKTMLVTTLYTIVSVPLGLIASLMLALLLNQRVRGVPIFRAFYYIPSLASLVAASLIWRKIFNPEDGLLNAIIYGPAGHMSSLGHWLSQVAGTPDKRLDWMGNEKFALPGLIIMSVWGAGGAMIILLAGLQGIPQHYYEAATLDGAGIWQRFKKVTLPLLTPALFFSMITGFIGSFQVFTQAYVITNGGPNDTTRFYVFSLFSAAFQQLRMGYAAALAWILFAIILLITLIQLKGGSRWVYYEADVKS